MMNEKAKGTGITREEFDMRIGRLDRCLSEFLDLFSDEIDEPDRQTLKHHADDLIGVGGSMLKKLSPPPSAQSARLEDHAADCSIHMPMDRTCDCGLSRNY